VAVRRGRSARGSVTNNEAPTPDTDDPDGTDLTMTMHRTTARLGLGALSGLLGLTLAAATAGAHVTAAQPTAPAGGYATIDLKVPHGCEGQATNTLAVQLRDDFESVKAQRVPGWEVSYERAPLEEPVEVHGRTITDYVATVTWTASGDPLPDDQYQTFGLSMKMPDLPGQTVLLPTVQGCVDGSESAWIEPDPDGDHPAPAVELLAATGGHGSDPTVTPAAVETDTSADDEAAAGTAPASTTESPAVVAIGGVAALAAAAGGVIGAVAGARVVGRPARS
jgi:periplasmic copper chaperone A